jgi:hypothetical protein
VTAVSSDANTVLNLFCIPEGFLAKRFVETDLQSDSLAPGGVLKSMLTLNEAIIDVKES